MTLKENDREEVRVCGDSTEHLTRDHKIHKLLRISIEVEKD